MRGGTASEWSTANPVLGAREIGVETDTGKLKIGDGTTDWNSLPYLRVDWGEIAGSITNQADLQTALSGKQDTLGYTPENTANKGVANGYCELDASGLIPENRLPIVDGGTP